MTMGPGAEVWERFGHNAIWIHDSIAGTDRIYNYGMFTFGRTVGEQLTFYRRFLMGHPTYRLAVSTDLDEVLAEYRWFGRDLDVQELRLPPADRLDLASRLAVNAEPDHAEYPYDYFLDNCSTRVRDMLDRALHGALRSHTQGRPAEGTLRFHTLRSLTNSVPLYFGIDAGLGPPTDRPLDQWGEMFLPAKLAARIGELQVAGADGVTLPLVAATRRLVSAGRYTVAPEPPHWSWRFLLASLLVGGVLATGLRPGRGGAFGRLLSRLWLLLIGLAGCLLLFLWLATSHAATVGNRNVLLFCPLAVLVAFGHRARRQDRNIVPWSTRLVGGSVLFGLVLALLPGWSGQENLPIAAATVVPTLIAVLVVSRSITRRDGGVLPRPA